MRPYFFTFQDALFLQNFHIAYAAVLLETPIYILPNHKQILDYIPMYGESSDTLQDTIILLIHRVSHLYVAMDREANVIPIQYYVLLLPNLSYNKWTASIPQKYLSVYSVGKNRFCCIYCFTLSRDISLAGRTSCQCIHEISTDLFLHDNFAYMILVCELCELLSDGERH